MSTAFCVARRPLSLNAAYPKGYVQQLADVARSCHLGALFDVPLYSRILWFHKQPVNGGDIDNVGKRIHDALKNVIFDDDSRITHALAIRVDAAEQVDVLADPANPDAFAALVDMLADSSIPHVLYVEIGPQPQRRIHLGPVTP